MRDEDNPDFSDLLDEFAELSKDVKPGDTIVIKIEHESASLEVFIDGYSVLKQQRRRVELPTPPASTNN